MEALKILVTPPCSWIANLGFLSFSTAKTTKPPTASAIGGASKIRRRPTLPGGFPPSTIGAGGLNFRVRDGIGWDPSAMVTGKLVRHTLKIIVREPYVS